MDRYALSVSIILKNKFEIYSQSDQNRQTTMAEITNKIMRKLGIDFPATLENTLLSAFKAISIVGIFLNNIFSSVIFFLIILCAMLIYSLMLGVIIK